MASRNLAALIAASTLLALAGCGNHYWTDRGNDFQDIWRLNAGIGPGVEIHVTATRFIQLGVGYYEGQKVGMVGRQNGMWYEWRYDCNALTGWGASTRSRMMGSIVNHPHTYGKEWDWSFGDENRRWTELGGTVWLIWFGGDAAFDLAEFEDFLLGWTTLDIMRDDFADSPVQEKAPVEEKDVTRPLLIMEKEKPKEEAAPPAQPAPAEQAPEKKTEEKKPAAQ